MSPESYDVWDRLVLESQAGTIYHTAQWVVTVSKAVGDRSVIYGVYDGEDLIGGVPVQVRRKGPFSVARRAFATPYSGLVMRNNQSSKADAELKHVIGQFARGFSRVTLTASPFMNGPALPPTWSSRERHTYLLSTGNLRGLWRGLASEARNRIRKAEKLGITAQRFFGEPDFYALFQQLFSDKGTGVPFDRDSFTRFVSRIEELAIGRAYEARTKDGDLCAACLVVYDRKRAYYSLAASDEVLRKTGAPSLLVWHILREFNPQVGEFDFGGANVPAVAQFKKKFRGRLVSYQEFEHFRSWPERLALQIWERLKTRPLRAGFP
jgi:hypothetical protein